MRRSVVVSTPAPRRLTEDLRADPALLCGCVAGATSAESTQNLAARGGVRYHAGFGGDAG
jgi:hypothetical protein